MPILSPPDNQAEPGFVRVFHENRAFLAEVRSLRALMKAAAKEAKSLHARLAAAMAQLDGKSLLELEVGGLKQGNERLKHDNDQLEHENERVKHENDQLKQESDQLKRESDQLKRENDQLKQENDNFKHQLVTRQAKLEGELAEATDRNNQLQAKANTLSPDHRDLHTEIATPPRERARLTSNFVPNFLTRSRHGGPTTPRNTQ